MKYQWQTYGLLTATLLCTILCVKANLAINTFNKAFYDALAAVDQPALVQAMTHFILIITCLILIEGYLYYFSHLLSARWRRYLTTTYLDRFLDQQIYYRRSLLPQAVDNPDQRIAEDLNTLPDLSITIFLLLTRATLTFIIFGYTLWHLTHSIAGYLYWIALFFGCAGVGVTHLLGKKLSHLDYQQQHTNANFRRKLIELQEHSEQIASYQAEQLTKHHLLQLFSRIYQNSLAILQLRKHLTFFTTGYSNIAFVLGLFLTLPLYLSKQLTLGSMMQIGGVFAYVVNSFTTVVMNYPLFADLKAARSRLTEFKREIDHLSHSQRRIQHSKHDLPDLTATALCIHTPANERLIASFDLTLYLGERLLITGENGCGKSTLLKALAGCWYHGQGKVAIPHNKTLLFIPQIPYLPTCTLNEALMFPLTGILHEPLAIEALQLCGLIKLLPYLHTNKEWQHELSTGEQQALTFARIVIQQPDIVFLDEATSHLDEETEKKLYRLLVNRLPNTSVLTVSHRLSLRTVHDRTIVIANGIACETVMPHQIIPYELKNNYL